MIKGLEEASGPIVGLLSRGGGEGTFEAEGSAVAKVLRWSEPGASAEQ